VKERKYVTNVFGRYLAKDVVDEVLFSPEERWPRCRGRHARSPSSSPFPPPQGEVDRPLRPRRRGRADVWRGGDAVWSPHGPLPPSGYSPLRGEKQNRPAQDRADRSALLPRIEVPALVIGGEEDALISPDVMRAMAKEIPGARTSIVPGAGHLPPLERPDSVNEALIELFEGRKVVWWR
jgi:pimeloyl-ACP methyl ester carboxylesterase